MVQIIKSKLFESININHGFSKRLKDKEELGLEIPVFLLNQKHTDDIVFLSSYDMIEKEFVADSIITNLKNVAVAVKTADCVPLLIADRKKRFVGAVHAGWMGTVKNIAGKTFEKIQEIFSVNSDDIFIAIGPSICGNCYVVKDDVMSEFKKNIDFSFYKQIDDSHFKIDLKDINKRLLIQSGIKEENIDIINECTYCKNNEYQSFRYHKNTYFYQISFIYI